MHRRAATSGSAMLCSASWLSVRQSCRLGRPSFQLHIWSLQACPPFVPTVADAPKCVPVKTHAVFMTLPLPLASWCGSPGTCMSMQAGQKTQQVATDLSNTFCRRHIMCRLAPDLHIQCSSKLATVMATSCSCDPPIAAAGTPDASRSQTVEAAIQQRDSDIRAYFDTQVLKHVLNPDHQKRSLALTREICGLKVAHRQLIAAHAAAKKIAGAASLQGVTLKQQLQVTLPCFQMQCHCACCYHGWHTKSFTFSCKSSPPAAY